MMARIAAFAKSDFLTAAAALIAKGGPDMATTSAIVHQTGAPVGSFYHRFASRDVLLAELWLGLVEPYQGEFLRLLSEGDAVEAALFTPRWVRRHPQEARVLLLHRREDFMDKGWPEELAQRAAGLGPELQAGLRCFTRNKLNTASEEAVSRVQFALIDVPLAAVRRHLASGKPVPLAVDDYVRECCGALLPLACAAERATR